MDTPMALEGPVATVSIVLMANGQVQYSCGGPGMNRTILLGLLEMAKVDIPAQMAAQANAPRIVGVPNGTIPNLRG